MPQIFAYGLKLVSGYVYGMAFFSAQELEKDLHGPSADSLQAEKRLAIFDKIFTAYHDARSCIRSDLVCVIFVLSYNMLTAIINFLLFNPPFYFSLNKFELSWPLDGISSKFGYSQINVTDI